MRLVLFLHFVAIVFLPVLGPLVYSFILSDYITMKRGKPTKDYFVITIFVVLFILQVIMFNQF